MNYLYTFAELFALRTNGWSCAECGAAWADTPTPGLWLPVLIPNPSCRHPQLLRATLSQ